jgi:HAD superfamily hydrolase (TIGR01509 family)
MQKKYLLFDNDGVLVHTEPLYFKANKKALKEFFNLNLEFEDYMEIMARGGTAWEKAQIAGIDEVKISFARKQRDIYYQEYLKTEDISIDGVLNILKELSKKYKMSIITTSRRVDFNIIHENRGITDFMDFILCEEDYKFAKPHPEPYLKGLKRFEGLKKEAIIIEDSQRGLTSAYRAGIDCVIVDNEFTRSQDFSKATYKINSLSELLNIL